MTPAAPAAPPASGQPPTPDVPADVPPTAPPAVPVTPPATPPVPPTPPATPPPEPPAPKAPAAYTLTVPDTAKTLLGDDDLAYLKDIAKASDWTNEEAQAELDATLTRAAARQQAMVAKFLADTTADKDYGGAKLTESQTLARSAINRLRPEGHPRRDSFLRFLNDAGASNHIEVVSFLADLGKQMAEDQPGHQPGGSGAAISIEDRLYPTTAKT